MKRQINFKKKAISPLIATLTLIGITLALFMIIFFWVSGFFAEAVVKFSEPAQTVCQRVAYTATYQPAENSIEVNNRGNIPLTGFSITIKTGGKTLTKARVTPMSNMIGPNAIDTITITDRAFDLSSAEKITITPLILGKGQKSGRSQNFPCKEKAMEVVK